MDKDSGNLYDEIGPKWLHGVTIVGDHCDKDGMMLILNDGNDDDEDAAEDGDDGGREAAKASAASTPPMRVASRVPSRAC